MRGLFSSGFIFFRIKRFQLGDTNRNQNNVCNIRPILLLMKCRLFVVTIISTLAQLNCVIIRLGNYDYVFFSVLENKSQMLWGRAGWK